MILQFNTLVLHINTKIPVWLNFRNFHFLFFPDFMFMLHLQDVGIEFVGYAAHHSTWDCTTVDKFFPIFKMKK